MPIIDTDSKYQLSTKERVKNADLQIYEWEKGNRYRVNLRFPDFVCLLNPLYIHYMPYARLYVNVCTCMYVYECTQQA